LEQDHFRNRYRIPSARLSGWNYASAGFYYITVCTHDRIVFFCNIQEGEMHKTSLGDIANQYWIDIPNHFPNVSLDEFVIMPNHVHGIIIINPVMNPVETQHAASLQPKLPIRTLSISTPKSGSISAMIRSYKSAVTHWAGLNNYPDFAWQSPYYDHIIRDEKSLNNIREYIFCNPLNWELDEYNMTKAKV
jgi:putative transposase